VKGFADRTPPPQGIIQGLALGTAEDDAEDLVKITTDQQAAALENGDMVKITGTTDYQGLYRSRKIDDDTFEIDVTPGGELGYWEKEESEASGLIFDGMISAYAKTADGKLQVTWPGHGLENGDEVQIAGTDSYNNSYPVQTVDDTHFVIDRKWATGEAVNVKLVSRRRRGVVFDGMEDYIALDDLAYDFNQGITVEAWVYYDAFRSWSRVVDLGNGSGLDNIVLANEGSTNNLALHIYRGGVNQFLTASGVLELGKWTHIAASIDKLGNAALYKNGVLVQQGKVHLPNKVNRTRNYVGRSNWSGDAYFAGRISDLRLWKQSRSGDEIKDTMYLQLTGKELGLVGYWRLGAIAEGKVIDFSPESNDGTVYGDCFVSAATLNRKLAAGGDAVKYSNPELFAVSERATYEESFEFKINNTTPLTLADLDNADGRNLGTKVFNFVYWGKPSRSAEEKKVIASEQIKQNKFEDLGNGWFKASANVTIPDGVSLLRTFEIGNIKGTWRSIEIRKHRVRLVSDSITEAKYSDSIALTTLANQQGNLSDSLVQLERKEQQEAELIARKIKIEEQLAFLNLTKEQQEAAIKQKQAEISAQQVVVNRCVTTVNDWQQEMQRAKLQVTLYEHVNYNGATVNFGIGLSGVTNWWNDRTSSVRVPQGLKLTLFEHGINVGRTVSFTSDYSSLCNCNFNDITSAVRVETIWGNTDIATVQARLNGVNTDLANAQAVLAKLQNDLMLLTSQLQARSELERLLAEVTAQLKQVQTELNTLNTNFITGVQNIQQTPQTMPKLSQDSRGLLVQGALLGFVQSVSRINVVDTCEGNVQLSYFDPKGQMRQTNYDATADSKNTAFEQWIPDALRTCLNFNQSNSVVKLDTPVLLNNNWTIEAWFFHALPKNAEWNTLTRGENADHHILVRNRKQLGIYLQNDPLRQYFYDSGFNMEVLSQGWHHLAAVANNDTTIFYIDGQKVGDTKAYAIKIAQENLNQNPNDAAAKQKVEDLKKGIIKSSADVYAIGNFQEGTQPFGKVAEVRIWGTALTAEEISINSVSLLSGNEPSLLAYYPMNEAKGSIVRDATGNGYNGTIYSAIWWGCSAPIGNPGNSVTKFDGLNDSITLADHPNLQLGNYTTEFWLKPDGTPSELWKGIIGSSKRSLNVWLNSNGSIHVGKPSSDNALTKFEVVKFDGVNDSITVPDNGNLQIKTYTLELWIKPDGAPNEDWKGIIGKPGRSFHIWLNKAGFIHHRYHTSGNTNDGIPDTPNGSITWGQWYHVAITNDGTTAKTYINGKLSASGSVNSNLIVDNTILYIGCNLDNGSGNYFKGQMSDVRIWKVARTESEIQASMYQRLTGKEANLVAYYLFNEIKTYGTMSRVLDLVNNNHATVNEAVIVAETSLNTLLSNDGGLNTPSGSILWNQWNHVAITNDGKTVKAYINGNLSGSQTITGAGVDKGAIYLGVSSYGNGSNYFKGHITELRVWKTVRSQADIQGNMYKRVSGTESNLVAYYPLDEIRLNNGVSRVSDFIAKNHGIVNDAMIINDRNLPISSDGLVSGEYTTITIDPTSQRQIALMRRFLAYPSINGALLFVDKRIEAVELKWVGNAQFAPTLLGYIEGAPPVPSENLTIESDYSGATSVELVESDDVEFSWNRSQDSGLGASLSAFAGIQQELSLGGEIFGVSWGMIAASIRAGLKANFDFSYQFQNESTIGSSSSLSMSDKLELRGTPEVTPKFPHLGNRFVPKNVGYALVVSAIADVFITKLARSGKMIGYQVQPVDGIPPDINTITFLMNPAYTMNGSLDGMTGTSATSSRFFKYVPEMRAQYGSLYPASYYRLKEAYDIKRQIEAEDKRRESYFSNFDVRLVDETSLNRNIDSGDAPSTVGVNREEDKPNTQTQQEKDQAQQKQIDNLKGDSKTKAEEQQKAAQQKQSEIQSKIGDQEKRVHATNSFAGWQKRMEDIQIRSGKRNIVNTYVWDADGGLRTESQSFANTVEHMIGGSFQMNAALGGEINIGVSSAMFELSAQATVNLTQTMSKTESRSKAFELNVDLSGVESKGITDHNDFPILPGEKVDRYRFMSFYLEGSTQHFQDFFNYVVDPEWLASNDEEARALRQTQAGKPNKAWRVLHRVTYVERPALMGFGRDVRKVRAAAEPSENQAILDKIASLEESNKNLAKQLDLILKKLNP
jgi:hypothetical protein